MYSVLQNKSNIQLRTTPFPYFIIDNALPEDLYNKLDKEFPEFENIIKNDLGTNEYKENTAYRYNASRSLVDNEISEDWRNFIGYHTSSEFTDELFDIFAEPIKQVYKVEKDKLPNKSNTGVRFKDKSFFSTDCQFVINTPTSGETSVIEPHLDNPKEFYAALLYMKENDDDSHGGNLTTHAFKDKPSFYGKSRVREEKVNLIEEIEYKKNRLAVFLNTPHSIHGVTKRSKTKSYRKYMNIIGEFHNELFDFRPFLE
tara:strand:+ start:4431 stop:5201 length:771 start_codon:yes stop_codon:yes gene_type:complete